MSATRHTVGEGTQDLSHLDTGQQGKGTPPSLPPGASDKPTQHEATLRIGSQPVRVVVDAQGNAHVTHVGARTHQAAPDANAGAITGTTPWGAPLDPASFNDSTI